MLLRKFIDREPILTLTIILFIIGIFVFSQANVSLSWDEATYMSLARHLHRSEGYYNPHAIVDSARPPLLPSLIAFVYHFFGENEAIARSIPPMLSILSLVAIYLLAKSLHASKVEILLAVLFLVTSPIYLLLSQRILTDVMFMGLMTLALLFLYSSTKKEGRFLLVASFLAGLCFLTRYTGAVLPLLFFLFILKAGRKDLLRSRYVPLSILIYMLTLIPWFILGLQYFGNPLGGFVYAAAVGIGSPLWYQSIPQAIYYIPALLIVLGAVTPLSIAGMYYGVKQRSRENWLLLLWVFLIFFFYFILRPEVVFREKIRFISPILPAMAIFAVEALGRLRKGKRIFAFVIPFLIAVNAMGGYSLISSYAMYEKHVDLMNVCLFIKDKTPSDAMIMAEFWPYVNYYADRSCIGIPDEEIDFMLSLKDYKVAYVLISKYFPSPAYAYRYLGDESLFREEYKIVRDDEVVTVAYRYLG